MNNTTITRFGSFQELGAALGYQKQGNRPKKEYVMKCRLCGAPMVNTPGTNVWTCPGVNDKGERCPNTYSRKPRDTKFAGGFGAVMSFD